MACQNGAPRRRGMEREQAEFPAELAVVALPRLLDSVQVGLQGRVLEERGAVDPLHRLVAGVPLPVGVRAREHLERLQPPGGRDVRARAEVDEGVLDRVARDDRPALLLDQLHLQRLAPVAEERLGLRLRHHPALVAQVAGRDLGHLPFDRLEVVGNERTVDDEVVEEAVVDGRSDAAPRLREQRRHRRGQEMRGAVPVEVQGLGGVGRHEAHLGVGIERVRQIDHATVDHRGERLPAEPTRDSRRQLRGGGAGGHAPRRSIRQRDGDLAHTVTATWDRAAEA